MEDTDTQTYALMKEMFNDALNTFYLPLYDVGLDLDDNISPQLKTMNIKNLLMLFLTLTT